MSHNTSYGSGANTLTFSGDEQNVERVKGDISAITEFAGSTYSGIFREQTPSNLNLSHNCKTCYVGCRCNTSNGWQTTSEGFDANKYVAARTVRRYAYVNQYGSNPTPAPEPAQVTCYHALCDEANGYFYYSDEDLANKKDTNVYSYAKQGGNSTHCLKPTCYHSLETTPGGNDDRFYRMMAETPDPTRDDQGIVSTTDTIATEQAGKVCYKSKWPTYFNIHTIRYRKKFTIDAYTQHQYICYRITKIKAFRTGESEDVTSSKFIRGNNYLGVRAEARAGRYSGGGSTDYDFMSKTISYDIAAGSSWGKVVSYENNTYSNDVHGSPSFDFVRIDTEHVPGGTTGTMQGVPAVALCVVDLQNDNLGYTGGHHPGSYADNGFSYSINADATWEHFDTEFYVYPSQTPQTYYDADMVAQGYSEDQGTDINQKLSVSSDYNYYVRYRPESSYGYSGGVRWLIDQDYGLIDNNTPLCDNENGYFLYSSLSTQRDDDVYTYQAQPDDTTYKCFKPICNDLTLQAPDGTYFTRPAASTPDEQVSGGNVISTTDPVAIENNIRCYIPKWPTHIVYEVNAYTKEIAGEQYACYKPNGIKLYRAGLSGGTDVSTRFTMTQPGGCTASSGSHRGVLGNVKVSTQYNHSDGIETCTYDYEMASTISFKDTGVSGGTCHYNTNASASSAVSHTSVCSANISNDINYNNGMVFLKKDTSTGAVCFMKPVNFYTSSSFSQYLINTVGYYDGWGIGYGAGTIDNFEYSGYLEPVIEYSAQSPTFIDTTMSSNTGSDINQKRTNQMTELTYDILGSELSEITSSQIVHYINRTGNDIPDTQAHNLPVMTFTVTVLAGNNTAILDYQLSGTGNTFNGFTESGKPYWVKFRSYDYENYGYPIRISIDSCTSTNGTSGTCNVRMSQRVYSDLVACAIGGSDDAAWMVDKCQGGTHGFGSMSINTSGGNILVTPSINDTTPGSGGSSTTCNDGYYNDVPPTGFVYSQQGACYMVTGCNEDEGYYSDMPNSNYFNSSKIEYHGTTCYKATCNSSKSYYSDVPDTSVFENTEQSYHGYKCYKATCNSSKSYYSDVPDTSVFENTEQSYHGYKCYKATSCVDGSKVVARYNYSACNPSTTSYHSQYCAYELKNYNVTLGWTRQSNTWRLDGSCPASQSNRPSSIVLTSYYMNTNVSPAAYGSYTLNCSGAMTTILTNSYSGTPVSSYLTMSRFSIGGTTDLTQNSMFRYGTKCYTLKITANANSGSGSN